MSKPTYEIDEALYDLFVIECRADNTTPSISSFLVWCDDNDYDRPEVYDGDGF
jgi:hypothetical protein